MKALPWQRQDGNNSPVNRRVLLRNPTGYRISLDTKPVIIGWSFYANSSPVAAKYISTSETLIWKKK